MTKTTSLKGITAMIMIVSILFLMPFASAMGEVKQFDKNKPLKGEISIHDNFGLPFISTKKADYTITSWTDQCLFDCSGEFLVNVYSSEKIFDDLKFKGKDGLEKTKSFKLFINDSESYQSPIYSQNCSSITQTNGTIVESCNSYQSGSETKYREIMKPYNFEVVQEGTYKVRLEAKKDKFESIDAIPSVQGQELSEWAWFNNSWGRKIEVNLSTASGYTDVNYSMRLNLTYDADMNANFSDVVIVNATENGTLGFWINPATTVNSAYADIWVFKPENITTVNQTIYVYYNNPLQTTSTSNCSQAFLFCDGAGSNNTAQWTNSQDPKGTSAKTTGTLLWSSAGSEYNLTLAVTNANTWIYAPYNITYGQVQIDSDMRVYDGTQNNQYGLGIWKDANWGLRQITGRYLNYGLMNISASANTWVNDSGGNTQQSSAYNHFSWVFNTTGYNNITLTGVINKSVTATTPYFTYGNPGIMYFDNDGVYPLRLSFKNYIVKRYSSVTPIAYYGAEQGLNGISTTLNSPVDTLNSSSSSITFNCSATGTGSTQLSNITFYFWNGTGVVTLSNAIPLTGTSNSTTYQNSFFTNGNWTWNCFAQGNDGTSDWGDANFTLNSYAQTPPDVVFNSQSPADLNLTNFLGPAGVNITYNVSQGFGSAVNLSTIQLHYKSNSSVSNVMFYLNGTAFSGYFASNYIDNSTNKTFRWNLLDNAVLPGTYNFGEVSMENTVHAFTTTANANQFTKVELLNVSNSTQYGFYEVMTNSTVGASSITVRYCNSTYTTGNVATSPNCALFGSLGATGTFNHVHTLNSGHQVFSFPVNTTSGTIGTVKITPTSYFVVGGNANWNIFNIANTSRATTIATTVNSGTGWTAQTYTVDSHLHQFDINSSLWYYACANDTNGNQNCTTPRQDLFEAGRLPPTAPQVYSPTNQTYGRIIPINYTASMSPNGYPISFYNITLRNPDETFNKTIVSNNSNNLGYIWDSSGTVPGLYIIMVNASDNISQTSYGLSEVFSMDNVAPQVSYDAVNPVNNSNITVNHFFMAVDSVDISPVNFYYTLYNTTGLYSNQTSYCTNLVCLGIYTFTSLPDGKYYYNVTVYDTVGNVNYTPTRTITIDTVSPNISIQNPVNNSVKEFGKNFTINYTASDSGVGVSNCWYGVLDHFDNVVIANTFAVNCSNVSINFTGASGTFWQYNLKIYANDSVGNTASTTVPLSTFYVQDEIYTANEIDNSQTSFEIYFSKYGDIALNNDSYFSWNGTKYYDFICQYYASIICIPEVNCTPSGWVTTSCGSLNADRSQIRLLKNITIPSLPASTVVPFFWSINFSQVDSYLYNSTILNQSIHALSLPVGTCAGGLAQAMCFSSREEQNLSALTFETLKYNFNVTVETTTKAFYGTLTNVTNPCVCINSTVSNNWTVNYGELQYGNTGYSNRRYYLFTGSSFTNATNNVTLYQLPLSDSTVFQITAQTTGLNYYDDHYVSLLRWYPASDEYKIVEMSKTDDNGQTVVNVKTNDVDYRLGLYEVDGTLVRLLNPIRMVCQTTPCVYSLITSTDQDLTSFMNVQTSLDLNTTSKVYTLTFNDPSQKTSSMNLRVYRVTPLNSTLVCNNTAEAYTGVLTCDMSAYTGTFRAEAWRSASPANIIAQRYDEFKESLGTLANGGAMGLFLGFLLVTTFALIGTISPVFVVILSIVALIPMVILGNLTFSIVMLIGAIGGVILHMLRRSSGQ